MTIHLMIFYFLLGIPIGFSAGFSFAHFFDMFLRGKEKCLRGWPKNWWNHKGEREI